MIDDPKAFTEAQRELFQRVATLIRARPKAFREAGKWLDEGADLPSAQDRVERCRKARLSEARSRRQVGRNLGRDAGRAYLVPMEGPTLAISRIILARRIRHERDDAVSEPDRYQILQAAADAILRDPPNCDRLRPDVAERQARRVLLTVWMLTDPGSLTTNPRITELQGWEWGVAYFSDDPLFTSDGELAPCEINRLYASRTLIDPSLDEWEKLTRDALRVLEEAEPGATAPTSAESGKQYTISALLDLAGVSDTTLNDYAKRAGVNTPGRGKRNHRYTAEEARLILQTILDNTSDRSMKGRCREAIAKL